MKALRISQNVVSIVGIWTAIWLGDGINASYKVYSFCDHHYNGISYVCVPRCIRGENF